MKTIATVYFCLAILPSIIHTEVPLFEELIQTADKNGTINGIFKPTKNGFLGEGSCGFIYQGELLKPARKMVAMKFIPSRNKEYAEKEYSIYTYLEAINKPGVERYGIPSVYYYGSYRHYTMMALTLLDKEINLVFNEFEYNIIDLFVTIREFVRITKYIHCRGIQHNDLTFDNMMFRRSQGFIIDYNVSEKMYETNNTATIRPMLRENAKSMAKKDWQQFFFPMCFQLGIMFDVSELGTNPSQNLRMIMEQLQGIQCPGLRRVYIEFAEHAFGGETENHLTRTCGVASNEGEAKVVHTHTAQKKPFYDRVYDIINEEIARFEVPTPNLVSWVKGQDLKRAKLDAANIPDISSIEDRFENTDAKYPEVHFDYFDKLIQRIQHLQPANAEKCSESGPSHSIQPKTIK